MLFNDYHNELNDLKIKLQTYKPTAEEEEKRQLFRVPHIGIKMHKKMISMKR